MRTSELKDAALDWAVGLAEGLVLSLYGVDPSIRGHVPGLAVYAPWKPTRYWNQCGPIIERELIAVSPCWHNAGHDSDTGYWYWQANLLGPNNMDESFEQFGATVQEAAMRCYVTMKLGEEIDIPKELQ